MYKETFTWRDESLTLSKPTSSIRVSYPSIDMTTSGVGKRAAVSHHFRNAPIELNLREIEILALKAKGYTEQQIADELVISKQGVRMVMYAMRKRYRSLDPKPAASQENAQELTDRIMLAARHVGLLNPITVFALTTLNQKLEDANRLPTSAAATTKTATRRTTP